MKKFITFKPKMASSPKFIFKKGPSLKKIRTSFWFISGFISKYYQWALLSFVFGALSLLVYFRLGHLLPQKRKLQKIGLVGQFTADRLPENIQTKISFGLVKIAPDGSALPDLAKSWEIKDDGKAYFFHLKRDIFWQDGTSFKAQDVAYSFKNVQFKALDQETLQVQLDEPFSPLPTLFSQPLLKSNYLGLGNYQLVNLKISGGSLQSVLLLDLRQRHQLLYRFYPSLESAVLAFKLGEIDILEEISQPTDLLAWPNVNIKSAVAQDQFVAVYLFTEDKYLANKSLRQALAYALENKENDSQRALGPFNPNSWAYNSQVKPYQFNLESAKEHFEKFKNDTNLQEQLTLELATTLSQLKTAEEIKKSWEKLDIKVQIRVVSESLKQFQAFLASRRIPPDPDQYSLWHSTQETNLTRFKSPKVDKLLEDGRVETDQEKRKEIYLDFQRFLVEDTPAIFLFHPKVWTISRKHL